MANRCFDLSGYDLIVSSESRPIKGIRKPAGARHVCYCHTPMRYVWDMYDEYYWMADRCVFAGAIPEAERHLKCASAVVSPSRWEGMPYLMMKARALGCRILATDCPGNRDVLTGYEKWEVLTI